MCERILVTLTTLQCYGCSNLQTWLVTTELSLMKGHQKILSSHTLISLGHFCTLKLTSSKLLSRFGLYGNRRLLNLPAEAKRPCGNYSWFVTLIATLLIGIYFNTHGSHQWNLDLTLNCPGSLRTLPTTNNPLSMEDPRIIIISWQPPIVYNNSCGGSRRRHLAGQRSPIRCGRHLGNCIIRFVGSSQKFLICASSAP